MTNKIILAGVAVLCVSGAASAEDLGLWGAYQDIFKGAKYVDLTHVITPTIPVWPGFGDSTFSPAKAGADLGDYASEGDTYTYDKHGFVATSYLLKTDQLGTQLDPPAHWAPEYPTIDELPATYTLRPLVVIPMQDQVAEDFGYALQVSDIEAFESEHGTIPEGSVVFVRSDWSKGWPDKEFAARTPFPGVGLDALKFLHEERHILFHGHEPLDTDATPNLEGEYWLMHNGYAQAEGVANLDQVPPTGCLVSIGYPKFKGGAGGYARYVAICPADWTYGVTISAADAPLPKSEKPLHWDDELGMRVR
ncbi:MULTISPECIES: cyclase family protein [Actibacterium]|jgi:kynurenine formamidase|uniref:Kynurenine formamidase n=1 Tax=Actibacterium naphthalenivorans TaxID=1614693 RepID=A0A840CL98_9RHOB|nr:MULTISPECIES: cyclase family protein [Actibacterium]ALG90509.1 cyclase [Actibacterium sp. EMB200-NS6]MBB4023939.1 kynurenine formamidase [Actibacterium naphthalenivorans]